jgi:hypothetical protein
MGYASQCTFILNFLIFNEQLAVHNEEDSDEEDKEPNKERVSHGSLSSTHNDSPPPLDRSKLQQTHMTPPSKAATAGGAATTMMGS